MMKININDYIQMIREMKCDAVLDRAETRILNNNKIFVKLFYINGNSSTVEILPFNEKTVIPN